ERDDRAALDTRRRAVDRRARDSREPLVGLARERALVLGYAVHAELLEILDGRRQADGLGNRRCPRLEPPRQIVPLAANDPYFLDHAATASAGLQTVEHRSATVHDTNAGRAQHLVRREYVKITFERGHIQALVRCGLSPVHDRERVDAAGPADHL